MDYVVGLGSNVGDRAAWLARARLRLAGLGEVLRASSLYESDPLGGPPQGRFLNGAVSLRTNLGPLELLRELLGVERALGRERRERWGPRTIDLDLLWADGLSVDEGELVLPHPRLHERTFALRPLVDVAPEASDPQSGQPYARLLGSLDTPRLIEVAGPDAWAASSEFP